MPQVRWSMKGREGVWLAIYWSFMVLGIRRDRCSMLLLAAVGWGLRVEGSWDYDFVSVWDSWISGCQIL